jgi:predicted deacylase
MSGTVMAVFDVSRPAIEGMQRRWPDSGRGIDLIDINREWPGNENGFTPAARHAGLLFSRLLKPNADYALDFHTGTTGTDIAPFLLARMEVAEVRAMAELFPVPQIFDSGGAPGILPEALIEAGIPALTPEVGAPRSLNAAVIAPFLEGTMNVLRHHGIIEGPIGRTGRDAHTFVSGRDHVVVATRGGFVELLVALDEAVTAGQRIAVQRNAFGEVVAEYAARANGRIMGFRTDATAEPGNVLAQILEAPDAPVEPGEADPLPE